MTEEQQKEQARNRLEDAVYLCLEFEWTKEDILNEVEYILECYGD